MPSSEHRSTDKAVTISFPTPKSEPNLRSSYVFNDLRAERSDNPEHPTVAPIPRSADLPRQSPKYWVKEKSRDLRQLLISDIEELTGRPLVVDSAQLDRPIGHTDPDDVSEILSGVAAPEFDFLIQTPGGDVDATEKLISILKARSTSYRVIVPSWAKSAGTVIALSAAKIVLGVNSELGPIDPQFATPSGMIPAEFIAQDPQQPHHVRLLADMAVKRVRQLASQILTNGMMKGKKQQDVDDALSKISTSNGYLSHGAD